MARMQEATWSGAMTALKIHPFEEGFSMPDPDLLDILSTFRWRAGVASTALEQPRSIVLSARMGRKNTFRTRIPSEKCPSLTKTRTLPSSWRRHERFSAEHAPTRRLLITLTGVEFWPGEQTSWCCWNYDTYVRLRNDADPRQLEKKLLAIRDKYQVPAMERSGDQSAADVGKYQYYGLQPVRDIYLNAMAE